MNNKQKKISLPELTPDDILEQKKLVDSYKENLKKYPKGSIIIQEKKGKPYLSLRYREGSKIRDKQIGFEDSEIGIETKLLVKKRDDLEKTINEIQKKLKANKRDHRS
jgi:hypothetical protein